MKEQAGIGRAGFLGRRGMSSVFAVLLFMAVAWGAVPAVCSAAVNPVVTPSRTTGVAPLYVFFDATSSTAAGVQRPMHELLFEWSFDDSGSGNWATDGESRNTAKGPVAAHVFETAGTYDVSLIASDGNGGVASTTATITVSDPDTVFSGTNTICFSQTSDFTGAPSGSQQIETSSWSTVASYVAAGKRLLLHRGQTWNVPSSSLNIRCAGPGTVGAFGTGAAPVLLATANSISVIRLGDDTVAETADDWRIMDLEIDGASYDNDMGVSAGGRVSQVLFLRLTVHDIRNHIVIGASILDYCGLTPMHDQIALVDSALTTVSASGNLAYIETMRLAVLGTVMSDSTAGEHVLRVPCANRGVISHNDLGMQAPSKHVVKLHAPRWDTAGVGYHMYTEKVVISDNTFTGNGDWNVCVGPQDSSSDNRVRNVIVERNFFKNVSGKQQVGLCIWAQEITARNNIFNCTGAYGRTGLSVGQRGIEPAPLNNRIYHNTAYASDGRVTLSAISSAATSTTMRNSLAANPSAYGTPTMMSNTGGTNLVSDHNLATNTPGFVTSTPVNAADFALTSASAAVAYGTTVPVWDDYTGADRPVGTPDAGACEYGTGNNQPPAFTSDPFTKSAATEDSAYSGSISGDASDPDAGDTLTFSKQSGPSWLSVASDGALSGTPTNSDVGANQFTVRVTDQDGLYDDATMNITVNNVNDAPLFVADPINKSDATEDSAYSGSLAADASDDDAGDTLTFSKQSGPSWLSVASNGTLSGTPTNADVGANQFTVRVTDAASAYDDATLNITVVNVNDAPTWNANPFTEADATVGTAYSSSIADNASDVDASDTLTFSKQSGPAWLSVASDGALSGTPSAGDAGATSFTVRVTDAASAYADATMNITVTAPTRVEFVSVGAEDGWISESSQGSGVGGVNSASETSSLALRLGDTVANQQYKTIVSFDTSSIPDGATITSATVYMRGGGLSGTNPWTWGSPCYVDIKGDSGFNGSTALENADFQASADATQVATMTAYTGNSYIVKGGFTGGLSYVNKTGKTQLRIYMSTATNANSTADRTGFYSGENSTSSNRPVLAVQYQ